MLMSEEVELIVKTIRESKNKYQLLNLVQEHLCLKCGNDGKQSDCWCDYSTPIECNCLACNC